MTAREEALSSPASGKEALVQWQEDQVSRRAASLALYTSWSIAPRIAASSAVAGAVCGAQPAPVRWSREAPGAGAAQVECASEALVADVHAPAASVSTSIASRSAQPAEPAELPARRAIHLAPGSERLPASG